MKRAVAVAFVFVLASAGSAAPPEAKRGERPAKEGKVAEKAEKPKELFSAETFTGLELRGLGPAVTSGRVVDFAVLGRGDTLFVAAASGGVWKTTNHGTSFKPIFDEQGSYSIGCVTVDPNNPLVVWVGSGENNSQRSVSYGDGVYRSNDGGKTWENVGLKNSEHIGRIVIDPRDSRKVFVAAQGPLWADGGDRGLYKTTDGGKNWKRVLHVSEHTGVNEVWIDPRNPDVMYASSYQRRRHVFTLIDGGPESAIYKSVDGGESWKKLEKGLPKSDKGKIGLAVSPANPDVVYAVIEASAEKDKGFYRSTDGGGSWERTGRPGFDVGAVLQRARPRPEEQGPRLRDGHLDDGDRGRRQDVEKGRREIQARGQPRALDRPGEHRPPDRGVRRRRLRVVGPRGDLGVYREPADHAVLPRRRRQRRSRVQRLRRDAGQLHAVRPVAHADDARDPQLRLVRCDGRRRLPAAH